MNRLSLGLRSLLEVTTLAVMSALALVVVYAVGMRAVGASPGWYDEVASTLLAWITWLGIAFAALRGGHMTVEGILVLLPPSLRKASFAIGEIVVHVTLVLTAIAGWKIVTTLGGETLVSLPEVPRALVQAVLPASAVITMLARALATPAAWTRIMTGTDADSAEIAAAIERAEVMHAEAQSAAREEHR